MKGSQSAASAVAVPICFFVLLSLVCPTDSEAQRNRKPRVIDESRVFQVEVQVGPRKRPRYVQLDCLGNRPGRARRIRRGVVFNPFAKQIKNMRARGLAGSRRFTRLRQLQRNGRSACREVASETGPVDVIDLSPYRGPFGHREAAILGERFCFGFPAEEQAAAVSMGLEAKVNDMLTWKSVPWEEAAVSDITCDSYLKGENRGENHPNERDCNPRNPKDFSVSGLRQSFFIRALGANCYHAKMVSFLADERGAPTLRYAEQHHNRRHLGRIYMDELWDTARTGDYREYVRRFSYGYGAVVLNLVESIKQNPNEDFAREFWELVTIGQRGLNGELNYGILDVASASLAFTGLAWSSIRIDIGSGQQTTLEYPAFVPDLHASGPKRVFIGSPHETTVGGAEDMIRAAFDHPSMAIDLARDICQEFFSPHCARSSISRIAQWIREDNFNLNVTMRRVMLASEHYKPDRRKTLVKHPVEYVVGFHRKIGLKRNHRVLDQLTDSLGQRMFMPPTIFGHYERELAGESWVLERRKMCMGVANLSQQDLDEFYGYDLNQRFLRNMNSSLDAGTQLIDRLATLFNVELSTQQRATMNTYLNFNYETCTEWRRNQGQCSQLGEYFLDRRAFDPYQCVSCEKLQGLLALFCMLPEMQTK